MFDYLLEKIASAPFIDTPFRHVEIRDFLKPEHFQAIINSPQIDLTAARSTEELLDQLDAAGFKVIEFPGCVTSRKAYLDWFHGRSRQKVHDQIEGFGMVLRLVRMEDDVIARLDSFFRSEALQKVLVQKFGIERPVTVDAGLQKYLHGYEISPHPDIRSKALTWMLNINPGTNSEAAPYHTQYLRLRDEWRFISEFWRHNRDYEREWLPWDWCETVKTQPHNNSIVFFSPDCDSVHGVKAHYDHLLTQRTQFYGNYWYAPQKLKRLDSRLFDLTQPVSVNRLKVAYQTSRLHQRVRALTERGIQASTGLRSVPKT